MTDRHDMTLLMTWLCLLAMGLVMVASASSALSDSSFLHLAKHGFYVLVALLVFALVASVPLHVWERSHRWCLFGAIAVCGLVMAPGIGHEVKGAQRWIDLGGFTLQPSEAAKFLLTVYLAGYLARVGESVRNVGVLLRPLFWVSLVLLLVLVEPDFGTAVVIALLTGGLLFLGGARLRHFIAIGAVGGISFALLAILEPYRAERLVSFLDPWSQAFGSGYQLTQALIAFGRAEWFGMGLGEGTQKLLYLPDAHNDFIFAVIAEELGFAGAAALLAAFVFLVLRIFAIAAAAAREDRMFAAYVAYGAGLLLAIQVTINIGVNTGALPTKGLTLPFISYGGNSLVVFSALTALALRAHFESAYVEKKP